MARELGRETIAVIGGTGPEGSGLALRWARAGFPVAIGSRDASRAGEMAARIQQRVGGGRVYGAENVAAAASAEIVVLTVPFAAQQTTLKAIRGALRPGQVVVDVTVPLAAAIGGRATRVLGVWEGSAAEATAESVPDGVSVVAAFHNISAGHLDHLEAAIDCDVLVCGDERGSKVRVARLVEALDGARFVDAGPLANARIVESITALLVGINIRYKIPGAGIRITGLPAAEPRS
ncbi:MAG TPA: NADPH-dependent F420 reductase [Chloroflexota bacterium]|nr:NADPH-dependent F420 reductase [Chloroflexota bacterium]